MNPLRELRGFLAVSTFLLAAHLEAAGYFQFVPNTTLTEQTRNNTGASSSFKGLPDGVPPPANTSKVPTRSLLYPGATTKIYAHYMGWFHVNGNDHIRVGYSSNDTVQISKQVNDMIYRGFSGVIASWDDHPMVVASVPLLLKQVETQTLNPGFEFAFEMELHTLDTYAKQQGCDVTTKVIEVLNLAFNTFINGHPAYMRINNRPVIFFFGGVTYHIDWNKVRASVPGNPLLVFRNSVAFSYSYSDGAFAWMDHKGTDPYNEQLAYLDGFYQSALLSPKFSVGSAWAGFNDNSASWGQNRIIASKCGLTWLDTFREVGKFYNTTKQLDRIRVVTWNDYEENTAIEPGIDSCLTLNASVTGNILSWSAVGATEETVHDYTIFMSVDGQNLKKLTSLGPTTHSLDLSSFGFAPGTYIFYVKAVAHPSIQNKLSNPIKYSTGNKTPSALLTLSSSSGAAPFTVTATVQGSDSDGFITAAKIDFGDGTVVAAATATHTYTNIGPYSIIGTVTDNSGLFGLSIKSVDVNPVAQKVTIVSPVPGATLAAPFQFTATADLNDKIKTFNLKVDGKVVRTTFGNGFNFKVGMFNGPHTLTAEATDINGNVFSQSVSVNVDTFSNPPIAKLQVTGLAAANTVLACTAASTAQPGLALNKTLINFGDGTENFFGPSVIHTFASGGTYSVMATAVDATGRTSSSTQNVTVGGPTATIFGKVTNISTGFALPNSVVSYSTFSTVADAAGNYTLKSVPVGGTFLVTAKRDGFLPRSANVTVLSAGTRSDFPLATAGKIAGVVLTSTGAPVGGATVTIKGGVIATTVTKLTDSTGRYATSWIPVGDYTVTVVKSGFSDKSATTTLAAGVTKTINFTE